MKKSLTLCIIHQHPNVLLGMKKRGFGEGRWNGFGGKVQFGESMEEAAKRELQEEAGINVENLEKAGVLEFSWQGKSEILEVHIFSAQNFDGIPTESEEMKPQWFHKDEIPFDEMWPDDRYWFPLLFAGKKFTGKFLFSEGDAVLEYELSELN